MSSTVGELKISLVANTASFTGGMAQAAASGRQTASDIKNSFDKVNFEAARSGAMLLEDSLGFRLPRHLNNLLTQLPAVQTAMAAALPIAGAVVLGEKIIELVEHVGKLKEAQDALRAKSDEIASAWQEDGQRIRAEIDAQEAKIVALNQGAVAGFEYAFEHAASVSISHLKEIQTELGATSKLIVENSNSLLMLGLDKPGTDLENFSAKLHKTMLDAEDTSGGDKFASIRAGIALATDKAAELQTKFDGLKQPSAMAGGAAMAAWSQQVDATKAEADAVDQVIRNLLRLSNLQSTTDRAHGAEDSSKRVEQFNQQYAAEKTVIDARTKEVIASYELEFAQGKITAGQLTTLKQAALDAQYAAEVAHFEKLKALDAGRPEELKKVLAEEAVAQAQHDTALMKSAAQLLDENKKGIEEIDRFNEEFQAKQVADQKRTNDAVEKAIDEGNKKRIEDFALIQGEGEKKIAAIDAEIKNLQRLITQYQLTGTSAHEVYAAIHQLSMQRQADIAQELLKSGKLGDAFHGTLLQMAQDGAQWQTKLANTFKQTVDGMNSSLASFVTTGKLNWQNLATSAIEGIVQMGLQWAESQAEMALKNAIFGAEKGAQNEAMAASNTAVAATEALASVPWPFNIAAAAETEGEGAAYMAQASVGLFAGGGEVPGFGFGDTVPAMLTPREMVLPTHLADVIRGMASSGGSGANARQNITYAPQINNALASASDIEARLKPHFENFLRSKMRSRYMGG